jgi:hypothetical protein
MEGNLLTKMERKKWIGGMPDMVTQFEPLDFSACYCVKSGVYRKGKPETRQQMVE